MCPVCLSMSSESTRSSKSFHVSFIHIDVCLSYYSLSTLLSTFKNHWIHCSPQHVPFHLIVFVCGRGRFLKLRRVIFMNVDGKIFTIPWICFMCWRSFFLLKKMLNSIISSVQFKDSQTNPLCMAACWQASLLHVRQKIPQMLRVYECTG